MFTCLACVVGRPESLQAAGARPDFVRALRGTPPLGFLTRRRLRQADNSHRVAAALTLVGLFERRRGTVHESPPPQVQFRRLHVHLHRHSLECDVDQGVANADGASQNATGLRSESRVLIPPRHRLPANTQPLGSRLVAKHLSCRGLREQFFEVALLFPGEPSVGFVGSSGQFRAQAATHHSGKLRWLRAPDLNLPAGNPRTPRWAHLMFSLMNIGLDPIWWTD